MASYHHNDEHFNEEEGTDEVRTRLISGNNTTTKHTTAPLNDDSDDEYNERQSIKSKKEQSSSLLGNNQSYGTNNNNQEGGSGSGGADAIYYDDGAIQQVSSSRKITLRAVFEFSKKWLALIVGCMMMLVSGTQYTYSSISPTIKSTLDYSQTEVTTIAAFANLGTYFSLPISLVNDFFGARVCSIVSSFLFFTGYFLFLLLYTGVIPNHYLVAGLFFMIMGSGSAGGYLASISTNLKNFSEKNRGLVVGVLASCFGLSSFVFSSIYTYVFSRELEGYLYFTAIFGTIVIFSGCIFMNSISQPQQQKKTDEEKKTTTTDLKSDMMNNEETTVKDEQQEEAAVMTYEEAATDPKVEKKVYADISANKSLEPPVNNPLGMLMSLDFYIMFVVYLIGSGCGLVIINNLGAIVIAYGGYNGQQNLMVQLLSVFNCIGRIVFGFLSDKFLLPKYHLTRVTFFNISILMMGVIHFVFAWVPVNSLYFFICVMGFFNGGIFSLAPSFCSERFGAKYFGMNFSIMNLAAACGSYGLATFVTGQLYQLNITPPRTTTCHGHDCFQLTFFITSSLCGFAFILGLFLQYRTRWVYWIFFRRRIAQSAKKQV